MMVVNFVGGGSSEGMVLSVGLLLLGFLCGLAAGGGLFLSCSALAARKEHRVADQIWRRLRHYLDDGCPLPKDGGR